MSGREYIDDIGGALDEIAIAFLALAQGIEEPVAFSECSRQPHVAVTQQRYELRDTGVEPHGGIDGGAAEPGSTFKGRQVGFCVKPVFSRLRAKQLVVNLFVVVEELAQKEVAYVSFAQMDRRHDVPHVVFAAVCLESSRRHAGTDNGITLDAVPLRLGVPAVESCADILPARADEHIALEVDDADADMSERVELIHDFLDGLHIQHVGEFQSGIL